MANPVICPYGDYSYLKVNCCQELWRCPYVLWGGFFVS
jgi:hypothetical protein